MAKIGLNEAELEGILLEGISDENQRYAIKKAILENNKKIESQLLEVVASKINDGMKRLGRHF